MAGRGVAVEAGEAGGAGAGEHALADPRHELLAQVLVAHREQQDRNPRAPVRRLVGRQLALDAGLAAAGDHRGREAGHGFGRGPRPALARPR